MWKLVSAVGFSDKSIHFVPLWVLMTLPYITFHQQLGTWALESDRLDSIPVPLLNSCATFVKLLNFSVLLFLYLKVWVMLL